MPPKDPIPDLPATLGPCSGMTLIGQGAMGAVYRARHAKIAGDVAIKVIHPRLGANDPKLYQRFLREVRLLRVIEHANVVRILDAGQDGRFVFAVMELVRGRSLGALRDDAGGRLEPGEVAFYLAQVARGLGAVYGAGTVHRDIKPDNVMVDDDGRARIADFGLARGQSSAQLTMADEVVGTPEYMAPEMVQHQDVDGRADLYALGITAYELLTGATPFNQGGLLRVVQDHISRAPAPVSVKRPGLPPRLCELVHRLLEKDPARRPADAAEAAALLEAFATPTRPRPAPARAAAPPPAASAPPPAATAPKAGWGGAVAAPASDPRATGRRPAEESGRLGVGPGSDLPRPRAGPESGRHAQAPGGAASGRLPASDLPRAGPESGRLAKAPGAVEASDRHPPVDARASGRRAAVPHDDLIEPVRREAPARGLDDTDPRRPGTASRTTARREHAEAPASDPRTTGRRPTSPPASPTDAARPPADARATGRLAHSADVEPPRPATGGPARAPDSRATGSARPAGVEPLRPATGPARAPDSRATGSARPADVEPPRPAIGGPARAPADSRVTGRGEAAARPAADARGAPARAAPAELEADGLPGWVALALVRLLAAHRVYPLDTLLDGLEAWRRAAARPTLDAFLVARAALPEETARRALDAARREAHMLRDRVALGFVRASADPAALERALRGRRPDEPLAAVLVREGALAARDAPGVEAQVDAALAGARAARAARAGADAATWRATVRGLVEGL